MNRRQWIIITLISLLALLAGVFSSHWISKTELASEPAIKAFFANSWKTPDGKVVNSADWQGKVLVVNFWASWCPPCVEEMPTLDLLQKAFLQENVLFVGIGIDSPSNIRQFIETTIISYPIVLGGLGGNEINKMLGNPSGALPFTVVINSKGEIKSRKLGKISEDELRKMIKDVI